MGTMKDKNGKNLTEAEEIKKRWQEYTEMKWSEVKLLSHVRLCFFIHGILRARILEWVTISFSRGSSQPRDRTWVSHIVGRCFNLWATKKGLTDPDNHDSVVNQSQTSWDVKSSGP